MTLAWLVTGKTVGGLTIYPPANRLDRETALRLWTEGNTWFSSEIGKKGQIKAGQLADAVVLSQDYFSVPEDDIEQIASVLTLLGGVPVYGDGDYKDLAPALPPPMPDWSPVRAFGGYQAPTANSLPKMGCAVHSHGPVTSVPVDGGDFSAFWGALGCSCWGF
jgi:hypothetical protein